MKKVILRRDFQGQDSWGAFKQIVAIDEHNDLFYRETEGGNCEYGKWKKWEGEERALSFVFGELILSDKLIREFKKCCQKNKELKNDEFNMECY